MRVSKFLDARTESIWKKSEVWVASGPSDSIVTDLMHDFFYVLTAYAKEIEICRELSALIRDALDMLHSGVS